MYIVDLIQLVCIFSIVNIIHSANVLLLPLNGQSQLQLSGRLASLLVQNGHNATVYVPSNNKISGHIHKDVTIVVYKTQRSKPFIGSEEQTSLLIEALHDPGKQQWSTAMEKLKVVALDNWISDCEAMFDDKVIKAMSASKFDLAIVDAYCYMCYHAIPYKLGIPYVTFSLPFYMLNYRVPALPSQWPSLASTSGSRISFWQRSHGLFSEMLLTANRNTTDYYVAKYVPEKPVKQGWELMMESGMWWYMYDLAVGYPKPSMPNTLDVGNIMARPGKKLKKEWRRIMEKTTEGVIIVSLGSHFNNIPQDWLLKFCEAFKSMKYTVVWKLQQPCPCSDHPNIITKPWLPQNDLLAHPKVKLFISHCGLTSLIESVNHGKPMIGFPVALDQPYNAVLIIEKGLGEIIDPTDFDAQDLIQAVDNVLGNQSYSVNVKHYSGILNSKEVPPGELVAFWVKHLVEQGHLHLKSAATELNLFQYLMVDIYLFMFVLCIIFIVSSFYVCRACGRCVRRRMRSQDMKAKKTD